MDAGAPTAPGNPTPVEVDGVTVTRVHTEAATAAPVRVEFEITNRGAEAMTYTVTFEVRAASGEALSYPTQIVQAVPAGRTVPGQVEVSEPRARGGGAQVQIGEVRSVPADEAPSEGGPCPPAGVRLYADRGDAAMGLRVVGLHLENCGTGVHRLEGYPRLQLLDEDHREIGGVRIHRGGAAIAAGTGADNPPRPLELKPGERAMTLLVWRNTVEAGDPVNVPYVRVRAKPGAAPVTVTPELDLGTTGELGVGAWQKT
ncbi:DUF4232 domain-containing protein [Streptomyces sp. WMMC500]|uniref:DUF4232 domain-containing protein n=1 Tax=Streptomyces sp. WMMC500 TaxID=3015154 RepID=UPI00248B149E|nr:DUF4232 domain-containing protein [Streptomyces sp. WMMC500]WBB64669.1 DUF4232 domain-containing protein [Streptomyces sp. WMMC500]